MLLSLIGKSPKVSKVFVRTLAAVLPYLGYKVTADTKKVRLKNADGTFQVGANGKGVYRRVGKMDGRFFAIPRWSKGAALILTARKVVNRDRLDLTGETYLSKHRGYLTIAIEHSKGRFLWDVQNRDIS
tara:strand:+ start:2673 stop:3059 length:387 start_codon:yes stop_codon:yes gene_type:complete